MEVLKKQCARQQKNLKRIGVENVEDCQGALNYKDITRNGFSKSSDFPLRSSLVRQTNRFTESQKSSSAKRFESGKANLKS